MFSLSIFVFFFFFAPTVLCLIIHLYDAVDTYVRELFPECNHARVCNYYERKLSQVRLSSLLPLPSSFSARIFLSFFSVFFFLGFSSFSKQRSSVEKYKEHLLSTGMITRKSQNSLVEKYSSRGLFELTLCYVIIPFREFVDSSSFFFLTFFNR